MFDFLQYQKLPDYLPWLAYDDDSKLFLLDGNYIGFTFSAQPLAGFEPTMERRFASLLNAEFPKGSMLQFNLMVFDDVSDHVADFRKARMGSDDPLITAAVKKTAQFVLDGAKGIGTNIPFRNATLLISVKIPIKAITPDEEECSSSMRLRSDVSALLHTIGFQELRVLNDTELLYYLSQIFNRGHLAAWRSGRQPVDESRWLREQVVDFDNTVTVSEKQVRVGDTYVSSLSVKKLPRSAYFGLAERLSVDSHSGDQGIPCTHMINCTIKIEDVSEMKPKIEARRNYYGNYATGPFARILPQYPIRHADWSLLSQSIQNGDTVHRFALNILLFSNSSEEARRNASVTRTYLNGIGFSFMEDAGVVFPLLRANLPLGPEKEDQRNLSRYRLMNGTGISVFVPCFFEWRGTPTPLVSLVGRGGQVMGFSPFDSGTNYNMTISAESGAGKSFLSNEMISSILATGGKVWVIDVGRSYMKLCDSLGGQFLSFEQGSNICLNPFSWVKDDETFEEVQDILISLLATMAAPQAGLDDFQTSALRTVLLEQFKLHGDQLSIDHIADACLALSKELGEGLQQEFREKRLSDISFGLRPFCKDGHYGKYFNGPANIDFTKNFVLLELEELKSQKHLQTVVLLMLIYQIQNGMYQGSVSIKKMLLIDEAWDLLSDPKIANFIEAGYRRFRKYNGCACIITQALTDLHDTPTGRAVLANSAATIMLQQKSTTLDKLASGDHPEFSRALCERLKTVRTVKGHFSEVFVRTATGAGIGRFVVDPFRSLLYSTHPDDVRDINRFKSQGMSTVDAITAVIEARQRVRL